MKGIEPKVSYIINHSITSPAWEIELDTLVMCNFVKKVNSILTEDWQQMLLTSIFETESQHLKQV